VGNGNNILFSKDRWLLECSLQTQYTLLYELSSNKDIKVSQAIGFNRFYLSFNRILDSVLSSKLYSLYQSLAEITFNHNQDELIWRWNSTGLFTTKSCYEFIEYRGVSEFTYQKTWSAKIPLKIIFFMVNPNE
jgi:hypothetical protein